MEVVNKKLRFVSWIEKLSSQFDNEVFIEETLIGKVVSTQILDIAFENIYTAQAVLKDGHHQIEAYFTKDSINRFEREEESITDVSFIDIVNALISFSEYQVCTRSQQNKFPVYLKISSFTLLSINEYTEQSQNHSRPQRLKAPQDQDECQLQLQSQIHCATEKPSDICFQDQDSCTSSVGDEDSCVSAIIFYMEEVENCRKQNLSITCETIDEVEEIGKSNMLCINNGIEFGSELKNLVDRSYQMRNGGKYATSRRELCHAQNIEIICRRDIELEILPYNDEEEEKQEEEEQEEEREEREILSNLNSGSNVIVEEQTCESNENTSNMNSQNVTSRVYFSARNNQLSQARRRQPRSLSTHQNARRKLVESGVHGAVSQLARDGDPAVDISFSEVVDDSLLQRDVALNSKIPVDSTNPDRNLCPGRQKISDGSQNTGGNISENRGGDQNSIGQQIPGGDQIPGRQLIPGGHQTQGGHLIASDIHIPGGQPIPVGHQTQGGHQIASGIQIPGGNQIPSEQPIPGGHQAQGSQHIPGGHQLQSDQQNPDESNSVIPVFENVTTTTSGTDNYDRVQSKPSQESDTRNSSYDLERRTVELSLQRYAVKRALTAERRKKEMCILRNSSNIEIIYRSDIKLVLIENDEEEEYEDEDNNNDNNSRLITVKKPKHCGKRGDAGNVPEFNKRKDSDTSFPSLNESSLSVDQSMSIESDSFDISASDSSLNLSLQGKDTSTLDSLCTFTLERELPNCITIPPSFQPQNSLFLEEQSQKCITNTRGQYSPLTCSGWMQDSVMLSGEQRTINISKGSYSKTFQIIAVIANGEEKSQENAFTEATRHNSKEKVDAKNNSNLIKHRNLRDVSLSGKRKQPFNSENSEMTFNVENQTELKESSCMQPAKRMKTNPRNESNNHQMPDGENNSADKYSGNSSKTLNFPVDDSSTSLTETTTESSKQSVQCERNDPHININSDKHKELPLVDSAEDLILWCIEFLNIKKKD